MDPELLKIMQGLGIDPSAVISGGGGASINPKDPPVFFGETRQYRADGDVLRQYGGKKQGGPITKTLTQANAAFYEMSEQALTELQQRLVGAGILDPKKVRLGDYDDDTYSAFAAINERAAKFHAVGRKVTPSDVLSMIERAYIDSGGEEAGPTEPGNVNQTTAALTLEDQVQAAAKQRLGRKLKASEVSKFVSLYQGMEGSRNASMNAAEDAVAEGADVTVEDQVSPDAAANQYLESNFAQEAAGQDTYGYLDALKSLVGG